MEGAATFGKRERRALLRALRTAEDLTGRFYCIPGREWPRYPYEVHTMADGDPPPAPAFADVVRLVRPASARSPGISRIYRIRLRDPALLEAARDRVHGIRLFPLLLYVITHELVHVIRFGGGHAAFDAPPEERRVEEERVHAITRRVLRPAMDEDLDRVIRAYRDGFPEGAVRGALSPK